MNDRIDNDPVSDYADAPLNPQQRSGARAYPSVLLRRITACLPEDFRR